MHSFFLWLIYKDVDENTNANSLIEKIGAERVLYIYIYILDSTQIKFSIYTKDLEETCHYEIKKEISSRTKL